MGYKMKGFSGFKESPAKQMPKNFNTKGSSGAGEKILTKQEKAAKHKRSFDKFQSQKQKGKEFVKNLKTKDVVSKKPTSTLSRVTKALKTTPKQLAKVAKKGTGRLAGGPIGAVLGAAYGAYKSGQKHSGGKAVKGQKTGVVTPDKSKSIWKK